MAVSRIGSYFLPHSGAWLTGAASIGLGVLMLFDVHTDKATELGRVLATLYGVPGATSPAGLILLGLGLWGIRAKQERDQPTGDEPRFK